MSTFIQLHLLTSYPPANLNRDDLGRPKTAIMGGVQRLRISSQSLKRAWRCSEIFAEKVSQKKIITIFENEYPKNIGFRSKIFSEKWIKDCLRNNGVELDNSELWSKDLSRAFGATEKDKNALSQLAHISDLEAQGFYSSILVLASFLKGEKENETFTKIVEIQESRSKKKKPEDIKKLNDKITDILSKEYLRVGKTSVDIALFGRMLASSLSYSIEAAAQVAHAISVHKVTVEDDFFTAVDDLNDGKEDAGAGHLGETEFAAGVFYLYICINRDLLLENLGGDEELVQKTISALTESCVTVAPSGKQNSFASRAYASYVLTEKGTRQPRSLSVSFLKPVAGSDILNEAISTLTKTRDNMDKVYGAVAKDSFVMNSVTAEGSLKELLQFVSTPLA